MGQKIRILCIGDVVGDIGTSYLKKHLPSFKDEYSVDVCIANGENSAQGNGITPFSAREMFAAGVDFITTGNHAFRRRESYDFFDETLSVIRPANYKDSVYGRGYGIIDKGFVRIGVANVLGTAFLEPLENPLDCLDRVIGELKKEVDIILVDFHAEATSEKRAAGFYLDGKVSAVFGTHTHVQTADEQILPNGTGYITDLGMTGPTQSVLGVKPEIIIERMKTGLPQRFENASAPCSMGGCIFTVDRNSGRTEKVERIFYDKE
jgi:metallophosphoesterase (TIGR00282 family)